MREYSYLILFLLICILSSCTKSRRESMSDLHVAMKIVDTQPDSALVLLTSIEQPEKLDKENYMNYLVTNVQAKYKSFQPIAEDTAIFLAKSYFEDKNSRMNILANYYSGYVYNERKELAKALNNYITALKYAKESHSDSLTAVIQTTIGDMYYEQNLTDSSIVRYKDALNYFNQTGSEKHQMHALRFLASGYLIKQMPDSALLYNNKGLTLAKQNNNLNFQNIFLYNLGLTYENMNKLQDAKVFLLRSLESDTEQQDRIKKYTNISKIYHGLQQRDSTNYYANLAEKNLNPKYVNDYTHMSTYKYLANLKLEQGAFREAADYQIKYDEYKTKIISEERSKEFLEVEKKYQQSENERKLMKMQMREQLYFTVIIFVILLLLIAILVVNMIRSRQKQVEQRNILLSHDLANKTFINDIYRISAKESTSFEKEVETLSLNYSIKEKSKGYEQIQETLKRKKKYTSENYQEILEKFLASHHLEQKVISELSSADLLLLSLIYCEYDHKDTAILLNINSHALLMRKQRLKSKLKTLGISETEIEKLIPKSV